jgi:putative transposase
MANTYSSLCYHIVFSTRNRVHHIKPEFEDRVWAYIGGVARKHNMMALQVGGIEDHIHALVIAPPVYAPSQITQFLKGDSSKWIHEEFPAMRGFARIDYIKSQRQHYDMRGFQEEYFELFEETWDRI